MQLFGYITLELSLEARVPLRSFSTSAVCPVFKHQRGLKVGKGNKCIHLVEQSKG